MSFKTRDRHYSTERRQNIGINTKLIWSKQNNYDKNNFAPMKCADFGFTGSSTREQNR